MIENQVILKVKKDERVYILSLSPDSPLGEVFDVLTEMRALILDKLQKASQDEIVEKKTCEKESCCEEGNVKEA